MTEKAGNILQQALEEQMEKEAMQVPKENEIRAQHSFSSGFLKAMADMVDKKEKVIDMKGTKKKRWHWRRFMKVVAACLALVLAFGAGAAVTDSWRMGSSKAAMMDMAGEAESAQMDGAYEESAEEDYGTETAAAADGASAGTAVKNTTNTTADEAASDELSGEGTTQQKLVYTSRLTVDTTEFDAYADAVRQKVSELGGYIEQSEVSGDAENGGRSLYMTIRVPAEKRNELTDTAKSNAKVRSQSESVEDVTLEYVDVQSHIEALQTEQQTLLGLLEKADSIDTTLAIQNQLTEVRYQLESYSSRLKVMQNQVDYSTLELSAYEVTRVTATEKDTFLTRLKDRFVGSLTALGNGCENVVLFILGELPILAVLGVLLVGIVLLVRRVRKNRKTGDDRGLSDGEKADEIIKKV